MKISNKERCKNIVIEIENNTFNEDRYYNFSIAVYQFSNNLDFLGSEEEDLEMIELGINIKNRFY